MLYIFYEIISLYAIACCHNMQGRPLTQLYEVVPSIFWGLKYLIVGQYASWIARKPFKYFSIGFLLCKLQSSCSSRSTILENVSNLRGLLNIEQSSKIF